MAAKTVSRSCLQLSKNGSPSRAFLQLASRSTTQAQPLFDFLAPSIPARALHALQRHRYSQAIPQRQAHRAFTTSSPRSATVAIHNPQKDDDGEEMMVEITARAAKRLKQIMAKDKNPDLALRITVESGGCHGFQYLMSLTTIPPLEASTTSPHQPSPTDAAASETLHTDANTPAFSFNKTPKVKPLEEDDTVFALTEETGVEGEGVAKVVMDAPSLELLKGSKIDYTVELIGSQFKITDNPLATSSCGCGTSFDIKA